MRRRKKQRSGRRGKVEEGRGEEEEVEKDGREERENNLPFLGFTSYLKIQSQSA